MNLVELIVKSHLIQHIHLINMLWLKCIIIIFSEIFTLSPLKYGVGIEYSTNRSRTSIIRDGYVYRHFKKMRFLKFCADKDLINEWMNDFILNDFVFWVTNSLRKTAVSHTALFVRQKRCDAIFNGFTFLTSKFAYFCIRLSWLVLKVSHYSWHHPKMRWRHT